MKQAAPLITTPPTYLCWLASFPRSGNTWVRNIFYEVFGLESGTWDVNDKGQVQELGCLSKPIVKTHMLPSQLMHDTDDKKAIYLVRDGRDAMVSIAHHRSDIVAPGSDFTDNMRAAILAEKGSFFGGWSGNVERWMERADLFVRYEDLLTDVEGTLEKIRLLLELPAGDYSKVPRFETMKRGLPRYGSRGLKLPEEERRAHSQRFFRRGKSGAWCDEMPPDLHDLFWSIHGDTMLKMGYRYDGDVESTPDPDLDWEVARLMGQPVAAPSERIEVTIEANDLFSPGYNAGDRQLAVLLKELMHVQRNPDSGWDFRLFAKGRVMPLNEVQDALANSFKDTGDCLRQPGQEGDSCPLSKELAPQNPDGAVEKGGRQPFKHIFKLLEEIKQGIKVIFLSIIPRLKRGDDAGVDLAQTGAPVTFIEGSGENHVIHLPLPLHYTSFSEARSPMVVTFRHFSYQTYPKFHSAAEVKNADRAWNFALGKNASLITTSKAAGSVAARLAGDRMPPLFAIHGATERARFHRKINGDDRRSACKKYGIPAGTPFFFTDSSMEPGDALENTLRAFLELVQKRPGVNLMLVVGGTRRGEGLDLQSFPGHDSGKVLFTGFIQEEDLPFLLSEALAFCHVSTVGGLDVPILETLNCGTPVICGNNASLLEIVGDAGLPVAPSDPHELSLQMQKILTDHTLRAELQKAALRQAARFSSRKMARETMNCYLKTLKQHRKLCNIHPDSASTPQRPMRDRTNSPFVYVHLGMQKTATTMLQQFLFPKHREIYPLGKIPHLQPNVYPLKASQEMSRAVEEPNRPMPDWAIHELRLRTRAAAENGQISVFSKEAMSGARLTKQAAWANLLQEIFGNCRILLTIREPLSFIEALYFEHLKAYQKDSFRGMESSFGPVPRYFTIDEWFAAINKSNRKVTKHFATADVVDLYADKFGKENVKVLIFEQLKQTPELFFRELCEFLDIDEEETRELCSHRSTNIRWTETPINRLKELQSCPEKSELFRRSSSIERASMLGLDMENDTAPKAQAEMSDALKQHLLELSSDSIRRLERDWNLPLREYGYQS